MVRTMGLDRSPMPLLSEIPLKLTRRCMDMFGSTSFDMETDRRPISKNRALFLFEFKLWHDKSPLWFNC